jgi:hypothetical protein
VNQALGIQSEYREEWAPVDATTADCITLEIKSAAYEQSWEQAAPSRIVFSITQRVADLYVFCLLSGREPADKAAWTFWVVPTEVGAFYWTVLAPDIVNPGREEQGSVSV